MKAILVLFDTLRKDVLPPYGAEGVEAPNFTRLAERSVMFNKNFVGSLPCMPARRELHTGRYNFLHRGWGPIEPFDDSMPEILKKSGVYTHLVSDHYHYWSDGGSTYHSRYSSWENVRGQENDEWKGFLGQVEAPEFTMFGRTMTRRRNYINRMYLENEADHPVTVTFDLGIEFIDTNVKYDNWFLQIETAAPHEPFLSYPRHRDKYPPSKSGKVTDWPHAGASTMTADEEEDTRNDYRGLVTMCDENLGRVLDAMDRHDMWKDTMLIVTTDHGTLLGENNTWGKNVQPPFSGVSNTPLFVWDPRTEEKGKTFDGLTQMIDIPASILDYFGKDIPKDMEGRPVSAYLSGSDRREAGLFGNFGGYTCCTDGRYMYMRASKDETNSPLNTYFLMPTTITSLFTPEELKDAELVEPFDYTKGCKLLKIPAGMMARFSGMSMKSWGTLLYDLESDPLQESPIQDEEIEKRMVSLLIDLMRKNDAPAEQYERLGLKV